MRPAPTIPARPRISPRCSVRLTPRGQNPTAHVFHFQDRLTDGVRHARELLGQAPADHPFDDVLAREGDYVPRADVLAVAQDGEAVGDLLHLFEKMADVDDGDAAIAQSAYQGEETPRILLRQ